MAASNRSALINRLYKVLKKHYKPIAPSASRTVLEQLLFACCLENAPFESAEKSFASLKHDFFDWNEVRVSMTKELGDTLRQLPDPESAAANLRRALQSVFEASYSFDLDSLKKQNLGQAIQRLKKIDGATPFVVSYVTQAALGGHSIPLDRGALMVLGIVGLADEADIQAASVPGLERVIAKSKGAEFGSLLHQLGAELFASPHSPAVHKLLLEIAPDAKDRLPKRIAKKPAVESKAAPPQPTTESSGKSPAKPAAEPPKSAGKPKSSPEKKAAAKIALSKKPVTASSKKPKPR